MPYFAVNSANLALANGVPLLNIIAVRPRLIIPAVYYMTFSRMAEDFHQLNLHGTEKDLFTLIEHSPY